MDSCNLGYKQKRVNSIHSQGRLCATTLDELYKGLRQLNHLITHQHHTLIHHILHQSISHSYRNTTLLQEKTISSDFQLFVKRHHTQIHANKIQTWVKISLFWKTCLRHRKCALRRLSFSFRPRVKNLAQSGGLLDAALDSQAPRAAKTATRTSSFPAQQSIIRRPREKDQYYSNFGNLRLQNNLDSKWE